MAELIFHRPTLEEYETVYQYMSKQGEGSCQHSFVTLYTLFEKYGDLICEKDGFLFVLRSHMCDENYRVYLAPMGNGDRRAAFEQIFRDAHEHDAKVCFFTLTESCAEYLEQTFPGKFACTADRDLAEYFYTTESMASFAGGKLSKRREEVSYFWRMYGERARVTVITPADFPEILAFEKLWLEENSVNHDRKSLEREARAIEVQLRYYEELHLSGIVLRIDGKVHGYGYGTKTGKEYYDALIEKGDKNIPHIYKVLRQESVKQCAMDCTYVNMEEDLGIMGLRNLKNEYHPAYLLQKYIVTEK